MNFNYLNNIKISGVEKLVEFCLEAESSVYNKPSQSVTYSRKALEFITKYIYTNHLGKWQTQKQLIDMLNDKDFVNYIGDNILINEMHLIRKLGNIGVHNDTSTKKDALDALKALYFVIGEIFVYLGLINDYQEFVEPTEQKNVSIETKVDEKKIDEINNIEIQVDEESELSKTIIKMRNIVFNLKHNRDDLENKKLFLEASLRESNWKIINKNNTSLPGYVGINMMLACGNTKADFVMYGRDNKPLAVIEFTETLKDLVSGRQAGIKKAEELSKTCGYKPVVYYSNGYYIYCIDQLGYKPRRVFSYHSLAELEYYIFRQTGRSPLDNIVIDDNITNRDYQKDAIHAVCNAFSANRRKSLIVMATGTGKTRVAISISDILLKRNWVKNILFLADRTSLVKQAHKNFNKLLPNVPTSIYAGLDDNRDSNAKIIFSTYQTMINLIDKETKEFGVGRFDLIIIDEAHRSIFNKYKLIFEYFDSLTVGLTATPSASELKNTYKEFGLENECPDYEYNLDQAVQDGFLVNYSVIDNTTEKIKNKVKYDDLSDEEKESLANDETFFDENGFKKGKEKYFINLSTIRIMLNEFMSKGIKINDGDMIGKTIIFADNHRQAEEIVKEFNHLYGYLGKDFCKLVDCQVDDAQNIIERFEVRDSNPQICVSVDMLDTGIDVPDILNLVFFKKVLSKIKFLQMIGRGTRLSKDIFGFNQDKKEFLIFDYYENFDYFGNPKNISDNNKVSLTEKMNFVRACLLKELQNKVNKNTYEINFADTLLDNLYKTTCTLINDNVGVQNNMVWVNKFRTRENWDELDDLKIDQLRAYVFPNFPSELTAPKIKRFDYTMLVLEAKLYNVEQVSKSNVKNRLQEWIDALLRLKNINQIQNKKDELLFLRNNCDKVDSLEALEYNRINLRDLFFYLPNTSNYFVVDVEDKLIKSNSDDENNKPYYQKAKEYLDANVDTDWYINICNLEKLTDDMKQNIDNAFTNTLGTLEDCSIWCNGNNLYAKIRKEIGINPDAIESKFGSFFNLSVLTEEQFNIIQSVIEYALANGDISAKKLFGTGQFSDMNISDIFGTNISYLLEVIKTINNAIL